MSEKDQRDFALSVLNERDDAAVDAAFHGEKLGELEKTADEMLPKNVDRYNELKAAGKNAASIMCMMLTELHVNMAIMLSIANDRRRELELRVQQLEARPSVKYLGVYRAGEVYAPGNMVTDAGSVWHCERSTMARPGTNEDWVLAVKRGRDAK